MKTLGILGCGGHGKVIAEAALLSGWSNIVFYDDAWLTLKNSSRWSVNGDLTQMLADSYLLNGVIVAMGDNATRVAKSLFLQEAGLMLSTVIHPSAVVSPYSIIGSGTFIAAQACVQIDSIVGEMCILNTGATVDHDCEVNNGVHISPGAHLAGGVRVGQESWIGIGATVVQKLTIGSRVTVGAGSVVISDVLDDVTVVGVPAHNIKV